MQHELLTNSSQLLYYYCRNSRLHEEVDKNTSELGMNFQLRNLLLYPDSGISMDEELVLGDMIWSYNKAELLEK